MGGLWCVGPVNDGTFRTLGAVEVTVSIPFTNKEKVETAAGRLTFSDLVNKGPIDTGGILNLTGRFVWESGDIEDSHDGSLGTVVLGPTAQGEFNTFGTKFLLVPMLNEGQVTWTDGDFSLSSPRAIFTNAGDFSIVGALSLRAPVGGFDGIFHNVSTGLVVKAGDAGTVATITGLSALRNDGTIECVSGTLSIQSPGEHTGDFDVADNCTIEFDGGGAAMTTVVKDPEGGGFPPGLLGSGWYRVKNMMTLKIEAYILTPQLFELAAGGVLGGLGTLEPSYMEWLPGSTMQDDGKVVIPSDGELYIAGEGDRNFDQRSIVVYGWVTWEDGDIVASAGAKVTVDGSGGNGVFDCQDDGKIKNPTEDAGTFTIQNNGVLQKSGGAGTTDIQMDVEQLNGGKVDAMGRDLKTKAQENVSGIIELNGGTLTVAETFQQDGGSTALGGGLLDVGGDFKINAGWLTLGGGTAVAPNGLLAGAAAFVSGSGVIEGDVVTAATWTLGDIYGVPASLSVVGQFTQTGGSVDILSGTFDVTEDFTKTAGTLTLLADLLSVGEDFSHEGGDTLISGPGNPQNTVAVGGAFSQTGGNFTLFMGSLLDVGTTVTLGGGLLRLDLAYLEAGGGVYIQSGGRLAASGYITGNVFNAGILDIGGGGPTSTLSIIGNYTQTGTLNARIDQSGTFDQLHVSGLATLGGTFALTLLPGAYPTGPYSVLTYGSRSGTFASLDLPPLEWDTWDPRYDDPAGTFTLWVIPWM